MFSIKSPKIVNVSKKNQYILTTFVFETVVTNFLKAGISSKGNNFIEFRMKYSTVIGKSLPSVCSILNINEVFVIFI